MLLTGVQWHLEHPWKYDNDAFTQWHNCVSRGRKNRLDFSPRCYLSGFLSRCRWALSFATKFGRPFISSFDRDLINTGGKAQCESRVCWTSACAFAQRRDKKIKYCRSKINFSSQRKYSRFIHANRWPLFFSLLPLTYVWYYLKLGKSHAITCVKILHQ